MTAGWESNEKPPECEPSTHTRHRYGFMAFAKTKGGPSEYVVAFGLKNVENRYKRLVDNKFDKFNKHVVTLNIKVTT